MRKNAYVCVSCGDGRTIRCWGKTQAARTFSAGESELAGRSGGEDARGVRPGGMFVDVGLSVHVRLRHRVRRRIGLSRRLSLSMRIRPRPCIRLRLRMRLRIRSRVRLCLRCCVVFFSQPHSS